MSRYGRASFSSNSGFLGPERGPANMIETRPTDDGLASDEQTEQMKRLHMARLASVGEVAVGIAHEINNSLMLVKTKVEFVKTMLKKETIDSAQFLEITEKVDETVNRMSSIVTGLKNYSRTEFSLALREESFTKIIDESLGFFMARFGNEGIKIDFNGIDKDLVVNTQPILLSQVLLNLVQNARDAIIEDDDPWIQISATRNGEFAEIRITDSGKGLSKEHCKKIFNSFYTTKSAGKGTGLGLSLSKTIIKNLGGNLYLDSEHSNTSFVIQLKL